MYNLSSKIRVEQYHSVKKFFSKRYEKIISYKRNSKTAVIQPYHFKLWFLTPLNLTNFDTLHLLMMLLLILGFLLKVD